MKKIIFTLIAILSVCTMSYGQEVIEVNKRTPNKCVIPYVIPRTEVKVICEYDIESLNVEWGNTYDKIAFLAIFKSIDGADVFPKEGIKGILVLRRTMSCYEFKHFKEKKTVTNLERFIILDVGGVKYKGENIPVFFMTYS